MTAKRCKRIEDILAEGFAPSKLLVRDQSHLHAGHPGARDGKGHFSVDIVSKSFAGQSRLERHRRVFDALHEMMVADIHALQINAQTPDEANGL